MLAQFFYVGVQIMCWTFIIQYGTRIFMERGMSEQAAEVLSQKYNIAAMILFCCSRFICTYLMKYFKPGKMLYCFAFAGLAFALGVILFQGIIGLYCLVAVSACMSLMFPTIYGIALEGLGEDAKFGAAGLIMAILGGSVLPPFLRPPGAPEGDLDPHVGLRPPQDDSCHFERSPFVISSEAEKSLFREASCRGRGSA